MGKMLPFDNYIVSRSVGKTFFLLFYLLTASLSGVLRS